MGIRRGFNRTRHHRTTPTSQYLQSTISNLKSSILPGAITQTWANGNHTWLPGNAYILSAFNPPLMSGCCHFYNFVLDSAREGRCEDRTLAGLHPGLSKEYWCGFEHPPDIQMRGSAKQPLTEERPGCPSVKDLG